MAIRSSPSASQVRVNSSGFNGNLSTTDNTVQKVAQALDDILIGGGGSTPTGPAGGDLVGTYPNPTLAQSYALASALTAHIGLALAAHAASAISVDAAGFNGNLATTDDTVQKVAQKVDDLSLGGTSVAARPDRATVYQDGGDTIYINGSGTVVSQLATTAANNVTVIQAALNAVAGTQDLGTLTTLGHGGGGTVKLSDQLYEVSSYLDVKYGTSLEGSGSVDRFGFVASAHSYQGTTIAPTSALAGFDIETGAGTTTRNPVILCGRTAVTTQSTTNPHGIRITGIAIDGRRETTAQGILLVDTQFVTIDGCVIGEMRGTGGKGIEVLSTLSPDDGAHATHIRDCLIINNEIGVYANGTGSTDSLIHDCRILQSTVNTISIGATGGGGGWQISGCHLTTGSTDMTGGGTEGHIYLSGAPCIITGNYFDTTGGYIIYADSPLAVITGNYFKMSSTKVAPIYLSGGARKATITGNTVQGSASCKGFVQFSSLTGQDYRPTITGNVLGDGGGTAIVGIAIDSAGNVVSETNAAMTIARDATANPYIWGNRIVQSAV